jgi:hypothetical protein
LLAQLTQQPTPSRLASGAMCSPIRQAAAGGTRYAASKQPFGQDYQAGCLRARQSCLSGGARFRSSEQMSWFGKWRAQKKPPLVERVTVHVLDVRGPKRTEFWQIDKDVARDLYERYKALNGHLYVLINYMDGEPRINLVTQKNWDLVKGNM